LNLHILHGSKSFQHRYPLQIGSHAHSLVHKHLLIAVVNLDTPYFKGHATVGLVANLAADALLGMDILGKSKTYVVTRSKSKQNEEIENEKVECEVHSQDLNEDVDLIIQSLKSTIT
jgi:hypothetical protein